MLPSRLRAMRLAGEPVERLRALVTALDRAIIAAIGELLCS
jgi:hypothetical protein